MWQQPECSGTQRQSWSSSWPSPTWSSLQLSSLSILLPSCGLSEFFKQYIFKYSVSKTIVRVSWSLHCFESRQFFLIPIVSIFCHRYIQDRPFCCASFAFLFYWHLVMIFAQIICKSESKSSRGKWKLWQKNHVKLSWSFATLLFMEAALAVNRWAAVCTHNLRWS